MQHGGFSELEYQNKKKTTRKERFLGEMNKILPWEMMLKPIRRHYPKAGIGRRPIDPQIMLKIYLMQQWYGLSDPAMEDSLYDIEAMRRFTGADLELIPDETTICKFRHFPEKNELTRKLFEVTGEYLDEQGLILSEGTIADASIVSAPRSTKNKDRKRDPDMKQSKKGNQWHFGMKTHIGTDSEGAYTRWSSRTHRCTTR